MSTNMRLDGNCSIIKTFDVERTENKSIGTVIVKYARLQSIHEMSYLSMQICLGHSIQNILSISWDVFNWTTFRQLHINRIALLENLIATQLVKKVPAFYGTRRFITVFTASLQWSLTW
jgi:hypothetical protein